MVVASDDWTRVGERELAARTVLARRCSILDWARCSILKVLRNNQRTFTLWFR
jgi:hypothetical protein